MSREPIPTWFFVLAAVRKGDRYLLVHESRHGQFWYFPAGRVKPGEDFITAAERETMEEAGIPVKVNGIVRIEHTPSIDGTRVRLIVSAEPADDTLPKSTPDEESLEADWFTLHEIKNLPLRGPDVVDVFSYLDAGGAAAPLTILASEGEPFG